MWGKLSLEELMHLNCGVVEDSWESLGLQGDPTSPSWTKSVLGVHWKDSCWSWNTNTLATWCEELTHLKRLWCWERLKAGKEGDHREWDDWKASRTQWSWVWVDTGSWWWTGRPGMLLAWGWEDLDMTERVNWTELNSFLVEILSFLYAVSCHMLIVTIFFFPSDFDSMYFFSLSKIYD